MRLHLGRSWLVAVLLALATAVSAAAGQSSADLQLSKSDSPDPVTAGQNITYTIDVENFGPNTAVNAVFPGEFPNRLTRLAICNSIISTVRSACPVSGSNAD